MDDDATFMRMALDQAAMAAARGETPVGAVLVQGGTEVRAAFGNEREARADPTAHAEVLALRSAAAELGGWRIPDATLYVTLEPCAMCAGAIVLARIDRVVFAASDPKAGACGSVLDILAEPALNHNPTVESGLLADHSAALLRAFFATRRHPATRPPSRASNRTKSGAPLPADE